MKKNHNECVFKWIQNGELFLKCNCIQNKRIFSYFEFTVLYCPTDPEGFGALSLWGSTPGVRAPFSSQSPNPALILNPQAVSSKNSSKIAVTAPFIFLLFQLSTGPVACKDKRGGCKISVNPRLHAPSSSPGASPCGSSIWQCAHIKSLDLFQLRWFDPLHHVPALQLWLRTLRAGI